MLLVANMHGPERIEVPVAGERHQIFMRAERLR